LLFTLCILQVSMAQTIIHVPADYLTIQEAIDAANPGDTVLVDNGLYYEQISFLGKKPLMVASHYLMDGDTNHINNTIIDGSQLTDMDNASVVYFNSGEDSTSVLCGFTIRNGKGTFIANYINERFGGGIFIMNAGAKIIHNKITSNILDDSQPQVNGQGVQGAGIGTEIISKAFWIVIENNQIFDNQAITQYDYARGGGMHITYNTFIRNNIIHGNVCSGTVAASQSIGGGIFFNGGLGYENTAIISGNKIQHNSCITTNGAASTGGVHIQYGSTIFTGNEVIANTSVSVSANGGIGGMTIMDPSEGCKVIGNTFRENYGNKGGGALFLYNYEPDTLPNEVTVSDNYFLDNESYNGGAMAIVSIPTIMENNVFQGNVATSRGAAIMMEKSIYCDYEHTAEIVNNSFAFNEATLKGGAIFANKAFPMIFNSIFYGNTAAEGPEIYINHPLDTMDLAYCDVDPAKIYGNIYDGGGNINIDPEFDDLVLLTLKSTSECINVGTQNYTCQCGDQHSCPQYDIEGINRPQGMGVEMGAYEMLSLVSGTIK